ncbi:MAG: GNAT family N-acetyltransferase [Clostridia bacterium]|nr:GNAT family N-acetyltransferase [Clostridia bacterium]
MSADVRLTPMTEAMYHAYFREYQSDPDLCADRSRYAAFVYDPEWVDRYVRRQAERNRLCFAVMDGDEMVGELILRDIEPHARATLSISMKNAACKDRGYGTRAERLAIGYAFDVLDIPALCADALLTNARSRHVLEKVGFEQTGEDGTFAYYRILREKRKEKG